MNNKYAYTMKTKYIIALLFAILISMVGCDKGFVELNKDPLSPTSLDPSYLLASTQDDFAGDSWHYPAAIVQQINLIITGQEAAGNHNIQKDGFTGAAWGFYGTIRTLTAILIDLEGNTERTNIYNMARILKAYSYMCLVDWYGDVPYTEAIQGYYTGNFYPVYDKQADIYAAIETELKAATDALDPAKDAVPNDMYYDGNIAKWKKFGNSLLLRMGMRYSKLNPTKAQSIVQTAVDPARGGVILNNDDNLKIPYNATQNNPNNGFCRNSTRQNWHAGKPLVDNMKANNDPRMPYLICLYTNPTSTSGGTQDTNPANQIGAPYGYDPSTIATAPNYPGEWSSSVYKYSMVNRQTCGRVDTWAYLITAAQTQLLLAEATVRGWISTGTTAQQYYEAGITAALTQKDMYSTTRGGNSPISAGQITTYLAEPNVAFNSGGTTAQKLEQINTQFWLASFLIWDEAWCNYRRTGYPVLTKNPYPGADPFVIATSDGFIHRMSYPTSEYNYNASNVEAAAASIGGDNLGTRIFWDIQ